jgi:hypothetical protein
MQDYAMIKNSKQKWEIGQTVNVGFMKGLEVVKKVPWFKIYKAQMQWYFQ